MNKKLIVLASILGGCYILKKIITVSTKIGFIAGTIYTDTMITKDFIDRKSKRDTTSGYAKKWAKYSDTKGESL